MHNRVHMKRTSGFGVFPSIDRMRRAEIAASEQRF
jgi:hypothetical protein